MVTPKIGYPQKKWLPQKTLLPQKNDQKSITPKSLAYFIARGFIIEFWKNGVLYFVRVY